MSSAASLLYPLLQRLERWKLLAAEDRDAILSLSAVERRIEAGHFIVREGDEPRKTCLLLSGFAFRQKESASSSVSSASKGDALLGDSPEMPAISALLGIASTIRIGAITPSSKSCSCRAKKS